MGYRFSLLTLCFQEYLDDLNTTALGKLRVQL
jgi:hypothetical protein